MTIPWKELVPRLSIDPDLATRDDVARLAAELMECRHVLLMIKMWCGLHSSIPSYRMYEPICKALEVKP